MKIRSRRTRSPRGFTLIEVMVASAILLVGIAAVVSALSISTRTAAHQRHVTQALHVTENLMEGLLLANAGHATLDTGDHGPRWFNDVGEETDAASTYEVRWSVEANKPIEGMKRLTVTTRWKEEARERAVSLTTDRP